MFSNQLRNIVLVAWENVTATLRQKPIIEVVIVTENMRSKALKGKVRLWALNIFFLPPPGGEIKIFILKNVRGYIIYGNVRNHILKDTPILPMKNRSSERVCFKNSSVERVGLRFKKRSTAMYKNITWSVFQMNIFKWTSLKSAFVPDRFFIAGIKFQEKSMRYNA